MKIHGICLVKNEADFMRYFLAESTRWCDFIYVYDNGSTDGTWQIVQEVARQHPQVVPFKQADVPFNDSLRAEVFQTFRGQAQEGDWWCRLDADEIYIDSPREFLPRLARRYQVVWTSHLQYALTTADLERFSPEETIAPPEISQERLPRFYQANASEARFFRHRPALQWPGGAWPRHLGLVAPERIRVKHLQYRSPAQIQSRLDTRREAIQRGWAHFEYNLDTDWQAKVGSPEGLSLDRGDGRYEIDPNRLPRHLEPVWQRGLKLALHQLGVWP